MAELITIILVFGVPIGSVVLLRKYYPNRLWVGIALCIVIGALGQFYMPKGGWYFLGAALIYVVAKALLKDDITAYSIANIASVIMFAWRFQKQMIQPKMVDHSHANKALVANDIDVAYPKPDRSNHVPNFSKTEENDTIDIGWDEGVLSDGRPFRAELWAQDQITSLTIFTSRKGIETKSDIEIADLFVKEGILSFLTDRRYVAAKPYIDASKNDMWSINIVVGDDENTFLKHDNLKIHKYEISDKLP